MKRPIPFFRRPAMNPKASTANPKAPAANPKTPAENTEAPARSTQLPADDTDYSTMSADAPTVKVEQSAVKVGEETAGQEAAGQEAAGQEAVDQETSDDNISEGKVPNDNLSEEDDAADRGIPAEPARSESTPRASAESSEATRTTGIVREDPTATATAPGGTPTTELRETTTTLFTSTPSLSDTPLAREIADLSRRRAALAQETLPLPEKTRIFTVANQKGGVGKTTTAVNLAAALARAGARVLVIDLDPQGNASTALGVDHHSEVTSIYDVLIDDEPVVNVIKPSPEFDGLFCVPATIHLAGAEIELVSLVAREQRLRSSLSSFLDGEGRGFHYVFIDCPPSLGLLTINAFVAATEVLIPIQCEYYALEGLSQLLNNIDLIEKHLNPRLAVSTILLTMFDSRTNLANQVAQDVRDHFPDQVLATPIPRSVRISEAPSYGQTVISYDTNSVGAVSYREAAAEMARRGAPN